MIARSWAIWAPAQLALLCLSSGTAGADNSADVLAIEKASNASLLWGPYRPNLYFGVRPRVPNSLLTGLLWARVEDYQSVQNSMLAKLRRDSKSLYNLPRTTLISFHFFRL